MGHDVVFCSNRDFIEMRLDGRISFDLASFGAFERLTGGAKYYLMAYIPSRHKKPFVIDVDDNLAYLCALAHHARRTKTFAGLYEIWAIDVPVAECVAMCEGCMFGSGY